MQELARRDPFDLSLPTARCGEGKTPVRREISRPAGTEGLKIDKFEKCEVILLRKHLLLFCSCAYF
jgi:hypothetical protein